MNDNQVLKFTDLGLSDALLKAVHDKGYTSPSPIQVKAIPAVISGRDVMAAAHVNCLTGAFFKYC